MALCQLGWALAAGLPGVGDVAVLFGSSGRTLLLAGVYYLGSHRPQLPS
jgi:hypothetical protein